MLFHRWETLSHIISDTKLPWFTKAASEEEIDYDFAEDETKGSLKYILIHKQDVMFYSIS